jgi:predicted membrane protein
MDETGTHRPKADLGFERDRERLFAVLGGVERTGAWEPAEELFVLAFWGGAKLDFREAILVEGETVVDVVAIMGGVEVLVPPDIDVVTEGSGVMGGFTHVSRSTGDAQVPRLRIKGLALMGGVEVKVA